MLNYPTNTISLPLSLSSVLKYASKRNSAINSLISHFERIRQILRYPSELYRVRFVALLDPCYVMFCDSNVYDLAGFLELFPRGSHECEMPKSCLPPLSFSPPLSLSPSSLSSLAYCTLFCCVCVSPFFPLYPFLLGKCAKKYVLNLGAL